MPDAERLLAYEFRFGLQPMIGAVSVWAAFLLPN
jgi:hypothetical protein